jgi:hypothetical protein
MVPGRLWLSMHNQHAAHPGRPSVGEVVLRVANNDGGTTQDIPEAALKMADVAGVGLVAGVPYVRGWAEAEQAAQTLRTELAACGINDRVSVRADVSAGGAGVVELGWVSPQVAGLLAGLLAQARADPATQPAQAA